MTQYLTPKLPTETVAYMADWAKELGGDIITTFTLTVSSGTVTLSEQTNFGQFIRFLVAGGANGETATLAMSVTTAGDQVLKRTLSLSIANGVTALVPITTTKQTIVNMAFEEIGLSSYEFDATPEEQFSALRRLDALMAQWQVSGLDLGYNFPSAIGAGNPNDPANIPDLSVNAVAISLALRIMPAIGKTMSAETRVALAQGLVAIRAYCAVIPERALPSSTALGAGNWRQPWWPFVNSDGVA